MGQRRRRDLHAQRLVRCAGDSRENGRAAKQRNGRLHGKDRCPEYLRSRAGPGQFDCAGQTSAQFNESDHRDQRRQARVGRGDAGRKPHHHSGVTQHFEHDRLRHECARGC